MARRKTAAGWAKIVARNLKALTRLVSPKPRRPAKAAVKKAKPTVAGKIRPRGVGAWTPGVAASASGARRYRLYRPPGVARGESLPLMVMLHGCAQDAEAFARSTRMNAIAARERFLVLYPEQDRLANAQGCWNWFATRSGRARAEVASIMASVDQVCTLYGADRARVAIAGLSAGASMATLVAIAHPERFAAVAMHSGVAPGMAQSSATALAAMQGRRPAAAIVVADGQPLPPLLVIQGAADRVVAPSNARAAAHAWAHAGDAREAAPVRESAQRRVQRGQRLAMRIVDFKRRAALVACLVEIDGLGHAWSGGAAGQPFSDPNGPDVSRLIWAFVAKRLREQAA
jgi:poly(hydroxyalkanoate) depolymerase family esterase